MAYVRSKTVGGRGPYYYLQRSYREDGKVKTEHLAYLGMDKAVADERAKDYNGGTRTLDAIKTEFGDAPRGRSKASTGISKATPSGPVSHPQGFDEKTLANMTDAELEQVRNALLMGKSASTLTGDDIKKYEQVRDEQVRRYEEAEKKETPAQRSGLEHISKAEYDDGKENSPPEHINYAGGSNMTYEKTYTDDQLDDAQAMIDHYKRQGISACVTHHGKDKHHLYVDRPEEKPKPTRAIVLGHEGVKKALDTGKIDATPKPVMPKEEPDYGETDMMRNTKAPEHMISKGSPDEEKRLIERRNEIDAYTLDPEFDDIDETNFSNLYAERDRIEARLDGLKAQKAPSAPAPVVPNVDTANLEYEVNGYDWYIQQKEFEDWSREDLEEAYQKRAEAFAKLYEARKESAPKDADMVWFAPTGNDGNKNGIMAQYKGVPLYQVSDNTVITRPEDVKAGLRERYTNIDEAKADIDKRFSSKAPEAKGDSFIDVKTKAYNETKSLPYKDMHVKMDMIDRSAMGFEEQHERDAIKMGISDAMREREKRYDYEVQQYHQDQGREDAKLVIAVADNQPDPRAYLEKSKEKALSDYNNYEKYGSKTKAEREYKKYLTIDAEIDRRAYGVPKFEDAPIDEERTLWYASQYSGDMIETKKGDVGRFEKANKKTLTIKTNDGREIKIKASDIKKTGGETIAERVTNDRIRDAKDAKAREDRFKYYPEYRDKIIKSHKEAFEEEKLQVLNHEETRKKWAMDERTVEDIDKQIAHTTDLIKYTWSRHETADNKASREHNADDIARLEGQLAGERIVRERLVSKQEQQKIEDSFNFSGTKHLDGTVTMNSKPVSKDDERGGYEWQRQEIAKIKEKGTSELDTAMYSFYERHKDARDDPNVSQRDMDDPNFRRGYEQMSTYYEWNYAQYHIPAYDNEAGIKSAIARAKTFEEAQEAKGALASHTFHSINATAFYNKKNLEQIEKKHENERGREYGSKLAETRLSETPYPEEIRDSTEFMKRRLASGKLDNTPREKAEVEGMVEAYQKWLDNNPGDAKPDYDAMDSDQLMRRYDQLANKANFYAKNDEPGLANKYIAEADRVYDLKKARESKSTPVVPKATKSGNAYESGMSFDDYFAKTKDRFIAEERKQQIAYAKRNLSDGEKHKAEFVARGSIDRYPNEGKDIEERLARYKEQLNKAESGDIEFEAKRRAKRSFNNLRDKDVAGKRKEDSNAREAERLADREIHDEGMDRGFQKYRYRGMDMYVSKNGGVIAYGVPKGYATPSNANVPEGIKGIDAGKYAIDKAIDDTLKSRVEFKEKKKEWAKTSRTENVEENKAVKDAVKKEMGMDVRVEHGKGSAGGHLYIKTPSGTSDADKKKVEAIAQRATGRKNEVDLQSDYFSGDNIFVD